MMQELLLMQYHLYTFFIVIACGLKCIVVKHLTARYKVSQIDYIAYLTLLIIFVGQIVIDISWILYIASNIFLFKSTVLIRLFFRFAWMLNIMHYQALSYLSENLFMRQRKLATHQKILFSFSLLFLMMAVLFIIISPHEYYRFEFPAFRYAIEIYCTLFLLIPSFFVTALRFRKQNLPFLLKKQNEVFFRFLGCFTAIDLFRMLVTIFQSVDTAHQDMALICSMLSATVFAITFIYYAFRIHHLRFLNMTPFVTMPLNEQLNNELINAYHRFARVSQQIEIRLILERSIARGLSIPDDKIEVTFLSSAENTGVAALNTDSEKQKIVRAFFDLHPEFSDLIIKNGLVLIHQDLQFSFWHSGNSFEARGTEFLEKLQADLFVPFTHEDQLYGFAIVRSGARLKQLYSKQEYETLSFWGQYAGQACCRISDRIELAQLRRYKEFEEEVFEYHQRLSKVHDALESIARTHGKNKIGTLLFRASQFECMNDVAERLLIINPNTHKGAPIAQVLSKIVRDVLKYKQPLYQLLENNNQEKLACTAQLFCSDSVLLFLVSADASDFLAPSLLLATERSDIDYVLCLQTTEQGKLLEQLFPSNQQPFFALKIALLKNALSKRSLWIEGKAEDLLDVVYVLHDIGLKERFERCTVTVDTVSAIREQLFGVSTQLEQKKEQHEPLLRTLDRRGTLLVENIDLLSQELQQEIALFIESGQLRLSKYSEPITVDVRLFCSGSKPFKELITTRALHPRLEAQFANRVLSLPAVTDISLEALYEFVTGISNQLVKNTDYSHLVACSRADIEKLHKELPHNLHALRLMIQKLLSKRSHEFLSEEAVSPEPLLHGDQLVMHAAKFGKRVLKDEQLMRSLWDRFKNQSKIAEILQVDRSTVSRCLKKLGYGVN